MKIYLIAGLNGAPIGLVYGSDSEITIGRELGNTISPMALDGVSRHHAKIYFKDGAWFVEDLGSSNGTYHKGVKIEGAVKLSAEDRIQFGPFEVCVHRIEADDASAPAPAAAPAPAPEPAPAPAAAPAPVPAPAPAAPASQPTVKAAPPLKPALSTAGGGIRKPVVGGALKPGLKLPPKPGLAPGLKLPPKPGLMSGLKLPPKPGAAPAAKPAASAANDGVAELEPVDMTPVE